MEEKDKTKVVDDTLLLDDLEDESNEDLYSDGKDETSKSKDDSNHDDGNGKNKDDEEKLAKEKQEKEERARYARLRREREEKEKKTREDEIRKKAFIEGKLSQAKVNSFTNSPIRDEYDLEVYETQLELESEGKDPNTDLAERIASLNRKKGLQEQEKTKKEKEQNEKIDKEIMEFKTKYPKININQLLNDPYFKEFSEGRLGVGNMTLTRMYESFNNFKSKFASNDEKEEDGKKKTPSSQSNGRHEERTYSQLNEKEKIEYLKKQGLI